MARIRTIKPEFWQDEDMALLAPRTQLLAIGLLNYADDEGYFKAHPALVKAAVFPLVEDSMNIPGMLLELSGIGYLRFFEGKDGKKYGQVVNFSKHQAVSKPTASKIKGLEEFREDSGSATGGLLVGKEQGTGNREQGTGKGKEKTYMSEFAVGENSDLACPDEDELGENTNVAKLDRCPVRKIVDLYHELLPELPTVQKITDTRRGYIQQRWREDLKELEHWRNFFNHVRQSDFLMGRAQPKPGQAPFLADLEWLTKPGNFAKIAEEKYHPTRRRGVRA